MFWNLNAFITKFQCISAYCYEKTFSWIVWKFQLNQRFWLFFSAYHNLTPVVSNRWLWVHRTWGVSCDWMSCTSVSSYTLFHTVWHYLFHLHFLPRILSFLVCTRQHQSKISGHVPGHFKQILRNVYTSQEVAYMKSLKKLTYGYIWELVAWSRQLA